MGTDDRSLEAGSPEQGELSQPLEAADRLPGVKELMELYECIEGVDEQMEAYSSLMDARVPTSPSDTSGPMVWHI